MDDAGKTRLVALLHGPDRPGLVARVSGWIYARGGNILHADQHRDKERQIFFQRVEWIPAGSVDDEMRLFREIAEGELGMKATLSVSTNRPKIVIMVSQFEHCFYDILTRCKIGEFNCEIACVISNHDKLAKISETFGIPYHHLPVSKETKAQVEEEELKIISESGASLVVMARYMQILSEDFLRKCRAPVINIHHSFLPAFAGAKPYHQAYERGVKIIGATAHYATADLDEGPIIAQDVVKITHRDNVETLIRKGRELERTVLASAIRCQLETRILAYGNKTVVFD